MQGWAHSWYHYFLNFKGCKAKYRRVISVLISYIGWSHWSRAEGDWESQEVILQCWPSTGFPGTQFPRAVPGLSLWQSLANVQHRAVDAPYMLGQNSPQPSVRYISLQDKGERKVFGEVVPTEELFHPLKCPLAPLHALDHIWGRWVGWSGQQSQG